MNEQSTCRRLKLLVVDLEPTPYKIDWWNAFARSERFDVRVLFTASKNWASDGGHDYHELPVAAFRFDVFSGKGIRSVLASTRMFFASLRRWKPGFVFISGYIGVLPLLSILVCACIKQRYAVHSDVFNNCPPQSPREWLKHLPRNLIRRLIFRSATAILVCGKRGYESAIVAGCNPTKVHDFPYAVDVQRIQSDEPEEVPAICRQDLQSGRVVLLFSGRMIPRKGLGTLLNAAVGLCDLDKWVLWIEGDGPQLRHYEEEAQRLGLAGRCRFLGFCQMSLHSWLLRNSDIVIVPSLRDSWGIVVDEGMQLGKAVVTSDATGSGADRIKNGIDGFVFAAGDEGQLLAVLRGLASDCQVRATIGNAARLSSTRFGTTQNVRAVLQALKIKE